MDSPQGGRDKPMEEADCLGTRSRRDGAVPGAGGRHHAGPRLPSLPGSRVRGRQVSKPAMPQH